MQTIPADKKIILIPYPFFHKTSCVRFRNTFPLTRNNCVRHGRHDTTLIASKTFWVIGFPGCRSVAKSSLFVCLFVCLFACFHQFYSLLGHFSSLTTTASWCFPSKGKNSLKHTSNPPELTFSNHKYIASFGFVLRVYLTETNTRGLEAEPCKKMLDKKYMKNY